LYDLWSPKSAMHLTSGCDNPMNSALKARNFSPPP
jgi:hypothetical protein